jgi:CDP-glucose 4,6-dehydratase
MENVVTQHWQGVRVFLTGHTGFKGGWLGLWLASKGATVRGYSLDPINNETTPAIFHAARIYESVEDIRGDILNRDALQQAMRDFQPDLVFHLAAQPLVRLSYADPLGTYATNVLGTANVLDAIRSIDSVRAVVVVTSDKCYENHEWHWGYRETDALGGYDPYSSSKACAEIVSAAYRSSFFNPSHPSGSHVLLATARTGNVIGGGDWSQDRLIPDLIRGFLASENVVIRNPKSIRPWQHVIEPLAGYLKLASRLLAGDQALAEPWNFGPLDQDAWPVDRIADAMTQQWGKGASWTTVDNPSVHEATHLKLDASKAHATLGWRPQLHLQAALEHTVDWYQEWKSGADMQAFTLQQIETYDKLGSDPTPHASNAVPT